MTGVGYKVRRTGYKVAIEDHPGLEVVIKPLSIQQVLNLNKLAETVGEIDEDNPGEAGIAAFETVLREFASLLESWNLEEEDDTPIPADFEGLTTLGLPFAMEILNAALQAVTQAPPPLSKASSNGSTHASRRELEDLIPMTPIGLASLPS